MTPKDKAKELIDKFSERTRMLDPYDGWIEHVISYKAKGHALTAVDELIEQCYKTGINYSYNFWQEVKKEIENYEE